MSTVTVDTVVAEVIVVTGSKKGFSVHGSSDYTGCSGNGHAQ